MKIEVAEPGRMAQSGSSLLKLIQNNNMPILDLLVRESIQNSLDAKNDKESFVTVDFKIGEFNKSELNIELEGITEALNKKYWKNVYKYIAICDSNTVGLTGKLHYDEVIDNQYGNLLKLIYEISKPQEAEGAGGSWGLGKTVYFRVGIGLVLYYSRIINEDGEYESRLAASLVENEMLEDSVIPVLENKSKRGIAWWGDCIGKNQTQPMTDEAEIGKILGIFGMLPYEKNMTGTAIIIPYIDEEKLLDNNQIEYKDGEDKLVLPFWRSNIDEYIRIAIQRWYAPRLNNSKYPYGKYLRALINGQGIALSDMEPSFQIVQALYNKANFKGESKGILNQDECETRVGKIVLRKVLDHATAGTVAFTKVPRSVLKTGYPDNKPEPYMYFNCEIRDKEKNKPVVSFTRKPGMVVAYEDVGNWVDTISSSSKDEYIFAIFVLDSDNNLTCTDAKCSLEEYVRKSEMADHTSWGDFSIGKYNPRIISKIQSQVKSKISKEFSIAEEDNTSKLNSGLGKMFGDLLLPPENFGKKSSPGTGKKSNGSRQIEQHKHVQFSYDSSKTEYSAQEMTVQLQIKSRGKISTTGVKLAIESESGPITAQYWEKNMGLNMPFEIMWSDIRILKIDGKEITTQYSVNKSNVESSSDEILCELRSTENGTGYGIGVLLNDKHSVEIEIIILLQVNRRDIKPLFIVDKDEGEK